MNKKSEQGQAPAWSCRQTPSLPTSPSHMLVHNNDEALDVKGKSKDDVDDGPSTPEILLNRKDWLLYDDHLHKEEKMGCGGR